MTHGGPAAGDFTEHSSYAHLDNNYFDVPVFSSCQCQKPPDYDATKFLTTFKDGFVAYTTYFNYDECTWLNRTRLTKKTNSTLAEYEEMTRERRDTEIFTSNITYKAQACTNKLVYTYEDEDEMEQSTNYQIVYLLSNKCAILQETSQKKLCLLYAYLTSTQANLNACKEKFPSTCDTSVFRSMNPRECKPKN
ncbi:uncharacterized protein ISCGN_031800 [Ixodes scapularis]